MKNKEEVVADMKDSLRGMNDYFQGLPSTTKDDVAFFVAAGIVEYNE